MNIKVLLTTFSFAVFYSSAAWAPPLGAALGAVAGAVGISTGTIIAIAVNLITSVALSALMRNKMKRNQDNGGIKVERKQTGGVVSRSIVLGYYATGGSEVCPPMSQGESDGLPNGYLTYVIALSDVPISAISRLIINGEYIPIDTSQNLEYGHPVFTDYAGEVWIKFYDGTQTTADPLLLSKFASYPNRPWNANMVGRGVAHSIITFKSDKELFKGEPEVRYELNGALLYDPRKDSSVGGSGSHRLNNNATWEYTENPVVMIYNILIGIPLWDGRVYGGKAEPDDLPLSNWVAAMNVCDETVNTSSGPQLRFRAGYQIDVAEDEPFDVIDELKAACLGEIVEIGGVYKIRAGGPGLPVAFLTDGDFLITKDEELDPFPSTDQSRNMINASFPHPGEMWNPHDAPTRIVQAYLDRDNGDPYPADIKLPACPFPKQVQRIMAAMLKDDQRWRNHAGSLGPYGLILEPLDVFEWTSVYNGYIDKEFEITKTSENLRTLCVAIGFREVDPNDYDFEISDELPDPVTPGGWVLPAAQTVPGFSVAPIAVLDDDGDERIPGIQINWEGQAISDASSLRIKVRHVDSGQVFRKTIADVIDGTDVFSGPLIPDTAYEVAGRPRVDRPTAWTVWHPVTTGNQKITSKDLSDSVYSEITEIAESAGILTYDELPAEGAYDNQIIMLLPPGQLYRWDETLNGWVPNVYAGIADGAIDDVAKFAQGIEPVSIIAPGDDLPTVKTTEAIVFEGKLYRWNGSEYDASIPTVDLEGAITPSQLAVLPGSNLLSDPMVTDANAWEPQQSTHWENAPGLWRYLGTSTANQLSVYADPVAIREDQQYLARMNVVMGTATTAEVRIIFQWLDANFNIVATQADAYAVVTTDTVVSSTRSPGGVNPRYLKLAFNIRPTVTNGTVEFTDLYLQEVFGPDNIANEAINAAKLAAGAVTETKIADDSISSPKIIAGAVQASEIAAGAISTAKLAAGAVTANEIAANAITAVKLDAGAVTTAKLAAGAVTANEIAAGAVSAAKIASNAITTDKLAANSITTAKIAAGAVSADEIAAGAIVSSKMAIGEFQNLVPDGRLQDVANSWTLNGAWSTVGLFDDGWDVPIGFEIPDGQGSGNGAQVMSSRFPIVGGSEYFASFQAKVSAGVGDLVVRLRFYDRAGDHIQYSTVRAGSLTTANGTKYSNSITAPADAVEAYINFYARDIELQTSNIRVTALKVIEKNAGELIVDGGITANKIDAGSITASKIAADAVVASKIAAGAIAAVHIAANTITAAKIAANTITSAEINVSQLCASSAFINNLDVDTLNIKGNAVTIPASQTLTSWVNWSSSGWDNVNTVTVNMDQAGSVLVFWNGQHYYTSVVQDEPYGVRIRVNGAVEWSREVDYGGVGSDWPTMSWRFNLPAGNHTFRVDWYSRNSVLRLKNRTLIAIGVKR